MDPTTSTNLESIQPPSIGALFSSQIKPENLTKQLMASLSSSHTRETCNNRLNGKIIKFRNELCKCKKRAIVRISESVNNPQRLYFTCETENCSFYKFWEPKNTDVDWSALGTNSGDIAEHQIVLEVRSLGNGLQYGIQGLQIGLQGLSASLGGMKMMIMLSFGISIVTLFAFLFIVMK